MSNSNRRNAFVTPSSNPTTKFIEWKSEQKIFSYYDKEKKENVSIPLPLRFVVLDELHTVKGWSDSNSSAIYSNEVKFISKQEMTVKPFKGSEIATGLYKDIKEKVVKAGGHYVRSIYVMLEDGSLANIQLKGSGVQAWGDFTQKSKTRLPDEWIIVKSAKEDKKGRVVFSTPIFEFERSLSNSEAEAADDLFNTLESYLTTYLKKEHEHIDYLESYEDDLDF